MFSLQLVVLVSAFVTVSTAWSVSCLLFFYILVVPSVTSHLWKWGHMSPCRVESASLRALRDSGMVRPLHSSPIQVDMKAFRLCIDNSQNSTKSHVLRIESNSCETMLWHTPSILVSVIIVTLPCESLRWPGEVETETGHWSEGSPIRRVSGPKNHCELRGTASLKHWTYYQGHQHLGAVAYSIFIQYTNSCLICLAPAVFQILI